MRLLLVTQDFPPQVGGIETYCRELARYWHDQVEEFAVLTISRKAYKAQEADFDATLPYTVYRMPAHSGAILPYFWQMSCPSFLKQHAFTHIFHAQWQTAIPSIRAKKYGRIKDYFVALHGRELLFNPYQGWPLFQQWYEFRKKKALMGATEVYSNSHFSGSLVSKSNIQLNGSLKVTGLAVDFDHFQHGCKQQAREWLRSRAGELEGTVLLSLCRLIERKGMGTCLKALRLFIDKHPDTSFTYCVAGEGPDRPRLEQLTKDLGLEARVRFIGNVCTADLPLAYGASELFLMPSRNKGSDVEGFGLVFLEAAAAGIPAIGSTDGGIPDAVLDGSTGLLVPAQQPEKLAEALEKMLLDEAYRQKLGKAGHARAQQLSWQRLAGDILGSMQAFA